MLVSSDQMNGLDDKVFTYETITKHFQFPMWLSCRLAGMPTIDALYGDAMYLPSRIIHLLITPHRAIGFKMIMHIFIAGLFFYLLLIHGFKAPNYVAFIGAAFYMLNPEFVTHVYSGHDGKMYVIAWLPFLVWRMKVLMENPTLFNSSLLALGVAMSVFTAHLQLTYFVLWGLFFYWVFYCICHYRTNKDVHKLIPHISFFWLAVFFGLGVAIIQLFPSFMYVREEFSVRGVDRGYEFAKSWSIHWPEIFSLWVPEFGNTLQYYWSENPFKLNYEYTGAMALLFAVIAVVYKPKPWRFFWVGVALFSLLLSLGGHTPVFFLVYHIVPMVKKFRACSMIMCWFSFSVVLLSTLFFIDVLKDEFSNMEEKRKKKWGKGLLIAIGVISVVSLLFAAKGFTLAIIRPLSSALDDPKKMQIFEANFSKNFLPFLFLWWVFAVTSLGMLWAVLQNKMNKNVFLTVIVIIGLIDTFRVNSIFIKVQNHEKFFYAEPRIKEIQAEMAQEPFRCFILPGTFHVQNNIAGIYKLEGVTGFHDNELKWYAEFRGRHQRMSNYYKDLIKTDKNGNPYLVSENMKRGNSYLNIANVKYLVTRNQKGQLVTIENQNYLRRLSFVPNYKVIDEKSINQELLNNGYDIRTTVALKEDPENTIKTNGMQANFSVHWEKYTPNYRRATVETDQDGLLRISEVYYPGWTIKIDNKPVKIFPADLSWMAVGISKGKHVVEMIPDSLYLKKCAPISIIFIIAIIGYWIFYAISYIKKKKIPAKAK